MTRAKPVKSFYALHECSPLCIAVHLKEGAQKLHSCSWAWPSPLLPERGQRIECCDHLFVVRTRAYPEWKLSSQPFRRVSAPTQQPTIVPPRDVRSQHTIRIRLLDPEHSLPANPTRTHRHHVCDLRPFPNHLQVLGKHWNEIHRSDGPALRPTTFRLPDDAHIYQHPTLTYPSPLRHFIRSNSKDQLTRTHPFSGPSRSALLVSIARVSIILFFLHGVYSFNLSTYFFTRPGPVMVLTIPPIRRSYGWKPAERVPTTYPSELENSSR